MLPPTDGSGRITANPSRPQAKDSRAAQQPPPPDRDRTLYGTGRLEHHPDGDWLVRPVAAPAATKTYSCPGCRQTIPPGTAHLVAWPAEEPIGAFGGVEDRRHWHRACWSARHRRR